MIHCDVALCVGCRMCEVACSAFHFGAVSPALSRIRVVKLEAIGIDAAIACLSCDERPCLECPTDALSVGTRGEILLDPDLCNACETCVEACPVSDFSMGSRCFAIFAVVPLAVSKYALPERCRTEKRVCRWPPTSG
jgi:Fe-S-cluster-containing hydrogenase component 2